MEGGNKEYMQKQEEITRRINEIFSGKKSLVAEYNNDKIVIKKNSAGDIFCYNYQNFVNSRGTHKVSKYDFTKGGFLKVIDSGELTILDEIIDF